jgi:hypothetical protein
MCPVAIESGKRRSAAFRWACDKRLRNHMSVMADSTRHHHPWARVLWACWQTTTTYNINNHRAAQHHIQQQG